MRVLVFALLLLAPLLSHADVRIACDPKPIVATQPDSYRCTFFPADAVPEPIPTPTPIPPPAACVGTAINASMSQATIQANLRADTTTCWAAGTYAATTWYVLPTGHKAICTSRRACVITGNNTRVIGFRVNDGSNLVRIQSFLVRDSANPTGWPNACMQGRTGGVLTDNEVVNCYIGISLETGVTVLNNFAHHNRHSGMAGGPGTGITVEGNEISFNNTNHEDPGNDASGLKFVGSTAGGQITYRNNYVHDNYGQGLWSDGNVRAVYENNRIENNGGAGIDHEISWDATIKGNTLKGNNTLVAANQSCWHGGEILVNNSQNVVISGNTITPTPGKNGICLTNSVRSESAWFPQFLTKVTVSGNTIFGRGATVTGVSSDNAVVGVMFSGNTYNLDSLTGLNWSMVGAMTKAQWQAAGQDIAGIFTVW